MYRVLTTTCNVHPKQVHLQKTRKVIVKKLTNNVHKLDTCKDYNMFVVLCEDILHNSKLLVTIETQLLRDDF